MSQTFLLIASLLCALPYRRIDGAITNLNQLIEFSLLTGAC